MQKREITREGEILREREIDVEKNDKKIIDNQSHFQEWKEIDRDK